MDQVNDSTMQGLSMRLLTGTLPFVVLTVFCQPLNAGLVLQPSGVTTNMGSAFASTPDTATIDKSGLSIGYVSQVTNFDSYIAMSPTHLSSGSGIRWASLSGTTAGNFDFDLGGTFTIESMALWNWGSFFATAQQEQGIKEFSLVADTDSGFSSPTNLGTFTAARNNVGALPAEVFTFTPTQAAHVRMQIGPNDPTDGNHGSSDFTSFGEVAFETTSTVIPESSALLGIPLAALFACGISLIRDIWRGRDTGSCGDASSRSPDRRGQEF